MDRQIIEEQSAYRKANGRYKQVLRGAGNTEIHEHQGPDGVGYTVYTYRTTTDGEEVRAEGRGAHCMNFDWRPVNKETE